MVDTKSVHKQLKNLKFGSGPWNQAEIRELPNILHENEKIAECVNGIYEGGFALLVATDMRVLLIDKKPLNFLNVEDLRFDMINEIDYSHRMLGATITISTGSKTMKFKSYNQPRLRKLIGLVQERMSEIKKEQSEKAENQQLHLEEINKQLQMYLLAQHQQLQQQVGEKQPEAAAVAPKPNPQLSDYLFAQRLLEQFQQEHDSKLPPEPKADDQASPRITTAAPVATPAPEIAAPIAPPQPVVDQATLVADAKREVFGKTTPEPTENSSTTIFKGLEINPLRIAYSKLPMALRNRKFGRPSMDAQQPTPLVHTQTAS